MELTTDIFQVISTERPDGKIIAKITINPQSEIFRGHFPGQPVVPGACMLQLVKDVLEDGIKKPLQLLKAGQLKFIMMLVPGNEQDIILDMTYKVLDNGFINITAKFTENNIVCFKFQGSFIIS